MPSLLELLPSKHPDNFLFAAKSSTAALESTRSSHRPPWLSLSRLLIHLSWSIQTVYYAVLGVQQAAARLILNVLIEAGQMFKEAMKPVEQNPWRVEAKVSSNLIADFSRSAVHDDNARLDSLVGKMDHLNVEDGE
jgi:hypothetical protein